MGKQEIFDKVAKHLLKQGSRSMTMHGTCAYRGGDGMKCAVGILIKDKYYNRLLEDHAVDTARVIKALKASGIDVDNMDIVKMLRACQTIHDVRPIEEWRDALKVTASDFKVNAKVLKPQKRKNK